MKANLVIGQNSLPAARLKLEHQRQAVNRIRASKEPPTIETADGTLFWKNQRNLLHREYDLPASITSDGIIAYYYNGLPHRDNGPAYIDPRGRQIWWNHGQLHRLDGPAIIDKTTGQEWYVNNKLHRIDGPAIIRPNGDQEYWLNNQRYSCLSSLQAKIKETK